jgi:very-short-patch-repair endonuclease
MSRAARPDDPVLVAIMNNRLDFAVARDQRWYRIPVSSAERWLKGHWPPQWLAFYQTKVFGDEAFGVRYYSRVVGIRQVFRYELFPDQPQDDRAQRRYYQLLLGPLQRRVEPIVSRRWRRITFIPSTWSKFEQATEINDLYRGSSLEEWLWQQLKLLNISAEREEFVTVKGRSDALDFAVYCAKGKIDVETDGDLWHTGPDQAPRDNVRNNDLGTAGWTVLRFSTLQISEQLADYCLPTIVGNINALGGVDEGNAAGRRVSGDPEAPVQPTLFDD